MSTSARNRLSGEKSPYLLQHAGNPVEWFPWGEEAFAQARREDKPIFLSVGYSTCHWCHVMEHESFESAAIAAFLADHFVSIKVDREERPDVDQVYMAFVQATTGHGGWPMSVWLTPELRPFFGGTYFPPTDLPGRPGFITVLRRIAELWKMDRPQIEAKASSLLTALREAQVETDRPADGDEPWHAEKAMETALSQYTRMFDPAEGGFGSAPKFPRPVNLDFLFYYASRRKFSAASRERAQGMALHTLHQMAAGGMNDQLGGGFHRYSVDAEWHVPHFEKMLYDQAQLAEAYLTGYQVTGDPALADVARATLEYVLRELANPAGGFFSAEDADSLPSAGARRKLEGAFYVWTQEEIVAALGAEEAADFCQEFGVEPGGNVDAASDPYGELTGANVLIRRPSHSHDSASSTSRQAAAIATLLKRRGQRPRPHLDDKILTAWNGLIIGALGRGAAVLDEPRFLEAAQRGAAFLRRELFDETSGELKRSYREGPSNISGFAADYAFLMHGLLTLYAADFNLEWLRWARRLQDTLDLHFWDQAGGGYFSTADRDPAILLRRKEDYDGAEPTPTSVAVLNLWRFGQIYANDVLLQHARHAVRAFAAQLEAQPVGLPLLLVGASLLEAPPIHVILHAPSPEDPALAALRREARRFHLPEMLILQIADREAREYFEPRHPMIAQLPSAPAKAMAYVCENNVCQLPVTEPQELRAILAKLASPSAPTPQDQQ